MTDDISKVVPPVHAATFVPSFSEAARRLGMAQAQGNRPATAHWQGIVDAHEAAAKAALRLESATTPAEVGEVSAAVADRLEEYSYDASQINRGALHDAATYIRTLARQLASANSEMVNLRAANIAYASEVANLYGRAGLAESQLAEATRRLGEVEGLPDQWLDAAKRAEATSRDLDSPPDRTFVISAESRAGAYRGCSRDLTAALTKEPAK